MLVIDTALPHTVAPASTTESAAASISTSNSATSSSISSSAPPSSAASPGGLLVATISPAILHATATSSTSISVSGILEIRCLLDNISVGGVIGKGGISIKQLREESGTFISIVKADHRHSMERIMVLKGSVDQIANATRGIAQLLIDCATRREGRTIDQAQLRLLIHKNAVGAIIGKLGATIREIQNLTEARVQVSNETLPLSSEKTVTLTGTASQLHHAMLLAATQLLQNPLKSATKVSFYVPGNQPLYAPPSPPPQSQQQMQAPHSYQNSSMQPSSALSPMAYGNLPPMLQRISIPALCCGAVIGKSGKVIHDLRSQTGCSISISNPDQDHPNERLVTLQGTPQAIQHAVMLIRNIIDACAPAFTQPNASAMSSASSVAHSQNAPAFVPASYAQPPTPAPSQPQAPTASNQQTAPQQEGGTS